MNDMEKCFYEPAELSVVDEGKGKSLVREKGSPYKLGFLVAQAADGIFKSLGDADAVDAMERVIVSTIRVMAMQRKAELERHGRIQYERRFQCRSGRGCAERNPQVYFWKAVKNMKIHNRSPTIKEVRKSEQCRHTFRITVAKCAPCDGYNLNCEHYEKTNKGAADTKHLSR